MPESDCLEPSIDVSRKGIAYLQSDKQSSIDLVEDGLQASKAVWLN